MPALVGPGSAQAARLTLESVFMDGEPPIRRPLPPAERTAASACWPAWSRSSRKLGEVAHEDRFELEPVDSRPTGIKGAEGVAWK